MKTAIKTLVTLVISAITLGTSAFAADGRKETILPEVKRVNKINVAGNVELILVQSADEHVKVYDNYYAKNALVQQKDGELRISSFDKETLTVVVYARTLSEITASANAVVKTLGKFNTLSLDVNLSGQASANLNANTIELTTEVSDHAKLTLAGTADSYQGTMAGFANVNMEKFTAASRNIQSKNNVVANTISINKAQVLGAE